MDKIEFLVASGDQPTRSLVGSWAREVVEGIVVLEAEDGSEAIRLGLQRRPKIALLEVDLPRLGGFEAATTLRELLPELRVALQAIEPRAHRDRASDHRLPVFDRAELDQAVAWVRAQAQWCAEGLSPQAKRSLTCAVCGYGVFRSRPPERCPMCQSEKAWSHAPRRSATVLLAG